MTSKNKNKKCPICEKIVVEEEYDDHVYIVCYNCNTIPTVVGYYTKKRITDKK